MKRVLRFRPLDAAILCATLCLSVPAHAQGTAKGSPDQYPDLVELDPFGGGSLFAQVSGGLAEKFADGGTAGGRATFNFSNHFGFEVGYNFMINNVVFHTPLAPGLPTYHFGDQIHYGAMNLVYNFTPRGARIRPYLTAGFGVAGFRPTAKGLQEARALDPTFHTAGLRSSIEPAANYGGGVKFHLSEHFGVRLDARGFWSPNPGFGLPTSSTNGIYIPSGKHQNGLQATLGVVIYIGQTAVPAPPAPPAPAPLNAGSITGGEGTLCQGKPITLHSTASDPSGHTLSYAWKLNGAPSGTNSADFSFTPNNGGDFTVDVTVSDSTNTSRTATAGPITLHVQEYAEPQITSISATPTELSCSADPTGTHTSNLSGQATGSACGGNLTYKWAVSEGSVTNDTTPNATFDASTLSFEGGAQGQAKTVTATLTVTDETGKSASRTTDIAVKCPPRYVRLPDIVFAKNNARVNNCGKRVLIDEAAPRVSGGDYDILLVGHVDSDERLNAPGRGRGRAAHRLDEQRVLNSAAVLTGGGATCAKVDPSRIKVDWVGTDQTSTPDPGLCGTSNRASQKERKGSEVSGADKNRRVEVYLIPRNSQTVPPAAKNMRPLPEREVRAMGCPK